MLKNIKTEKRVPLPNFIKKKKEIRQKRDQTETRPIHLARIENKVKAITDDPNLKTY